LFQLCLLRGVVPMMAAPMSEGSGGWAALADYVSPSRGPA
jgi:hypothetical protein